MAIIPQLLYMTVVGIFVRKVKRGEDVASVRIGTIGQEQFLIDIPIFVVDRIIEGQDDHLWSFFQSQIARYSSSVRTAEAVGQCTVGQITTVGRVRIMFRIAPGLVRSIGTVDRSVAKQFLVQTFAISTSQLIGWTDGRFGGQ